MSWAKVDDGLYDDPRFEAAGLEAMGLWVAALSYMGRYLTDGVIDEARVRRIAGRRAQTLTDRLVSAGWWEREPGGKLRLISWDTYLLSRAEVEADRERKSTAGRRGAERTNAKRLESGPAGAAAGAVGSSDGSRARDPDPDPVPSRPVPTPEEDPPKVPHGGTGGQIGIPFQDSPAEGTPIPTSGARRKSSTVKEPRTAPERPAAERYIEAFVLGLADAGITITPPRTTEGAQLGRVAAAHAREGGGPITGDALLAWFRREARAFGKAITRPELHRGGRTAFGFGTWLDNGCPVQERRGDEPEDDGPDIPEHLIGRPGWSKPRPLPDVKVDATSRAMVWDIHNAGRRARGLPEEPMPIDDLESA